jgi:HEPN domain-containing protein
MRLSSLQQAVPWLAQAVADLETATLLAPSRPYAACFYAQQAAEKAVKVIYVANSLDFPWSHSVHQLLVEAAEAYPELLPLAEVAGLLDRYYVGTRYPDFRLNSTEPPSAAYSNAEAERAVELARNILEVCQNIYGQLVQTKSGKG